MSTFAPFSALVGAAVTALVSYLIYRRGLQERVARELLSEALAIQALEEAWIVQGYDESASKIRIHEHPDLKEERIRSRQAENG